MKSLIPLLAVLGLILADSACLAATSPAAINYVWLSPKFADASQEFRPPVPSETIQNMLATAARNPDVDVLLWVDSRRLTETQMTFLIQAIAERANFSVKDLRSISAYAGESLFNREDLSPDWRINKHSLIWQQVDAARILASLHSGYKQAFYSDADVSNLVVNSEEIQTRMSKHGIVISGGIDKSSRGEFAWYENQMFGFDLRTRPFFEKLYRQSIRSAYASSKNGYGAFIDLINRDLKGQMGIETKEVVFGVRHDGSFAYHPGSEFSFETITIDCEKIVKGL